MTHSNLDALLTEAERRTLGLAPTPADTELVRLREWKAEATATLDTLPDEVTRRRTTWTPDGSES